MTSEVTASDRPATGQTAGVWGSVVDRVFRDRRTGRIVVAQWPNPPLAAWLVLTVLRAVFDPEPGTAWRTVLDVGAAVALAWWAVDEILRGVNPWRRALGAVVLAGLVVSLVR
jgi:hypothetical protein